MRRWWPGMAGWALVAVGAVALLPAGRVAFRRHDPSVARVVTLEVGGMTCEACVTKIHGQLVQVPGVVRADVSLHDQRAVVRCRAEVADTSLIAAVRRAGPDYLGLVLAR